MTRLASALCGRFCYSRPAKMRAAAIFGLCSSTKDLKRFQKHSDASWRIGLPADSGEADAILIFGGDGTVHRHLAQLVKLKLPVLVVPCGSGNDFARALKLRNIRDSVAAWRRFCSDGSNVRAIDLGVITPLGPEELKPDEENQTVRSAEALRHPRSTALCAPKNRDPKTTTPSNVPPHLGSGAESVALPAAISAGEASASTRHYFCCVGGVGLDAEVARQANGLPRWLRAHGGYVLSFLPALFQFAAIPMRIKVPHPQQSNGWVTRNAKPTVLAAFANAPTYGGGMKIAPHAQLDDGKLDICIVSDINKFKLFCLFPTIYFGRHLNMPEVEYFQAERLKLETEMPLEVYADGEYVCRTPTEVGLASKALS